MAITAWDSEGMVWDDLTGKQLYPYAEALRLALKERYETYNTTSTIPAPLDVELEEGVIPTWGWVNQFKITILSTILNYVNHNDSGGDWTNSAQLDCAPPWTINDMLTQIGDVSLIYPSENGCFKADWALQQYKMLNQVCWYKQTASSLPVTNNYREAAHADWATCVANFNATAWGPSIATNFIQHSAYGGDSSHGHSMSRTRASNKYQSKFGGFLTTLNHKLDGYIWAEGHPFKLVQYQNNDFSANEDTMGIIFQVLVPSNAASHTDLTGGFGDNTMTQPPNLISYRWEAFAATATGVSKWNVDGGFKFVDVVV